MSIANNFSQILQFFHKKKELLTTIRDLSDSLLVIDDTQRQEKLWKQQQQIFDDFQKNEAGLQAQLATFYLDYSTHQKQKDTLPEETDLWEYQSSIIEKAPKKLAKTVGLCLQSVAQLETKLQKERKTIMLELNSLNQRPSNFGYYKTNPYQQ